MQITHEELVAKLQQRVAQDALTIAGLQAALDKAEAQIGVLEQRLAPTSEDEP